MFKDDATRFEPSKTGGDRRGAHKVVSGLRAGRAEAADYFVRPARHYCSANSKNPARFVFAQIWRAAFARHGQFSGPGARYTSRQGLNEAF